MVPLLKAAIEVSLERYLPSSPGPVLDAGCGRQPFRAFVESAGRRYIGSDAEQNPEGTVEYVCRIDEPLPAGLLNVAPFGFILCTEVLEHILHWPAAFANLRLLAAAGGHLVLSCPHFYPPHEEPSDYWRTTVHAIIDHATAAGFDVVEQRLLGDAGDVMGTLLGASSTEAVSGGLIDRALARTVRAASGVVFQLLQSPWFRQRVAFRGGLYLSNVVVLRAV